MLLYDLFACTGGRQEQRREVPVLVHGRSSSTDDLGHGHARSEREKLDPSMASVLVALFLPRAPQVIVHHPGLKKSSAARLLTHPVLS